MVWNRSARWVRARCGSRLLGADGPFRPLVVLVRATIADTDPVVLLRTSPYAVARDPVNAVDGKPPEIVVRFPKGVSPEVAAALRAKGVKVIGTERPPVPPRPGDKKDKDHD